MSGPQYKSNWKDYYTLLNLSPGCEDSKIIERNYRLLIQTVHTDLNPTLGEDKAKDINEAFECLKEPSSRKSYWLYYQSRQNQKGRSSNSSQAGSSGNRTKSELMKDFHNDMISYYHKRADMGHLDTIDMIGQIERDGGHAVALRFTRNPKPTSGLRSLKFANALNYSLEALVIEPKYSSLFSQEHREKCRILLSDMDYRP